MSPCTLNRFIERLESGILTRPNTTDWVIAASTFVYAIVDQDARRRDEPLGALDRPEGVDRQDDRGCHGGLGVAR